MTATSVPLIVTCPTEVFKFLFLLISSGVCGGNKLSGSGEKLFGSKSTVIEAASSCGGRALARAIDVQLDIEGYDKENQDYYDNLNSRLQKVFPELVSTNDVTESKKKGKSSNIVTPSAGGSSYKGNRVRMTQDQLRMARELGINDEASLKKYAAEIQRSQGR